MYMYMYVFIEIKEPGTCSSCVLDQVICTVVCAGVCVFVCVCGYGHVFVLLCFLRIMEGHVYM